MISVIIPCSRMARFLPDVIGSNRRQAVAVDEILVVDDGLDPATDATCATLAAPIRVIHTDPCHPGVARNRGLAEARGDVIGFLDADDLWPASKLGRQCARLDADPEVDMVSGHITYFDRLDPDRLAPAADARTETVLFVHLGACLFRRRLFDRIGAFDPSLRFAEDVDLFLRLREQAVPFVILRAVTLYYRRHEGQMMQSRDPRQEPDFRRAVMLSFQRRRRLGMIRELPLFETYLEPPGEIAA
jgi:glycosyltransferase involved in cell wall biosynthesis